MDTLLEDVKQNLVVEHDADDILLRQYIAAAVDYAEGYQHLPPGTYSVSEMPPATRQAVILLASHFYESRDGSTGGVLSESAAAAKQVWNSVRALLSMGKEWIV